MYMEAEDVGDNGLIIILVPKFYNSVFLFVDIITLGILIEL